MVKTLDELITDKLGRLFCVGSADRALSDKYPRVAPPPLPLCIRGLADKQKTPLYVADTTRFVCYIDPPVMRVYKHLSRVRYTLCHRYNITLFYKCQQFL